MLMMTLSRIEDRSWNCHKSVSVICDINDKSIEAHGNQKQAEFDTIYIKYLLRGKKNHCHC